MPKKPGNATTRSPPTQANHDMSRKCEHTDPANRGDPNNRWPRSARLTKVVGGVGGAIVNKIRTLMKKD